MVKLNKAVEKRFVFQERYLQRGLSKMKGFLDAVSFSGDVIKITVCVLEKEEESISENGGK